jgi:hypothetical protein
MCMSRYIEVPGVQEHSIWLLRVVAAHSKPFCQKVKVAGAEAAIKSACEVHPEHARIKLCADACEEVFAEPGEMKEKPAESRSLSGRYSSAKKNLLSLFKRDSSC